MSQASSVLNGLNPNRIRKIAELGTSEIRGTRPTSGLGVAIETSGQGVGLTTASELIDLQRADLANQIEVPVVVEEDIIPLQYELRNEAIYGASDCEAFAPAVEEDTGCFAVSGPWIWSEEQVLAAQVIVEQLPLFLVFGSLENLLIAHPWNTKRSVRQLQVLQQLDGRRGLSLQEPDQD